MRKLALVGLAAVALMVAAAPARAQGISLTGETGVARTPLAMALAPKSFTVAGDLFSSEDTFIPLRAEFGVIEGLEVGFNYWYMDTKNNATQWGLNAKYAIPREFGELIENLSLAVGINYQSQSHDGGYDVSVTRAYAVGTYLWDLRIPITPSLGFVYEVQGGDKDQSGVRLFGSVLARVMPNLAIGAEYEATNQDLDGDDADSSLWFGARFWPRKDLSVQAGITNNANVGGNDTSDYVVHVGAQYSFSLAK